MRRKRNRNILGSDPGKGRRLPLPNIPGDEWENHTHPEEKSISQMQCKPSDINLDEGFTAIKAQENKPTKNKRERDAHTHV